MVSSRRTSCDSASKFHGELRSFFEFARKTSAEDRHFADVRVPVYENEFWTSKQRDAHSIHEISYRACYKPQLPGFFIRRFCQSGDIVYDPFMGRGTTLIEAQLHGFRAFGNDANPLSKVLTAPRLNPPSLAEIQDRLAAVELQSPSQIDPDLLVFFHPETLDEIYGWKNYFHLRSLAGEFDDIDGWIQMIACNRLTGHSSGFFSVYSLPPNLAASVESQKRINQKKNQVPLYRDTKKIILKKSRRLLRHELPGKFSRDDFGIFHHSADDTGGIPDESVGLVVTSPPFLDTINYVHDNWLRMWFCEIEIDPDQIWQIRSLASWIQKMTSVFHELKRVLKPGGVIAFEVGEIRKGVLRLENEVVKAGLTAGLKPECILINSQDFTKTANCWGISNNQRGTNSNRIVVFKK